MTRRVVQPRQRERRTIDAALDREIAGLPALPFVAVARRTMPMTLVVD